jgi:hypothetical protein
MPEIVNDALSRLLARCSSDLESMNINNLPLIAFRRVRERYQWISWIVSLLLGHLQRRTARTLAVIPLFRFQRIKEFCGFQRSRRCFFPENSENSRSCSWSSDRDPGSGPNGRPGMTLRVS